MNTEPRIQPLVTGPETEYRVQYVPYDATVVQAFEDARVLIQSAAESIRVEHVGSTAIPGLGGRHVLDVAVVAEGAHQPTVYDGLSAIGLQPAPFAHYLPVLVGLLTRAEKSYPLMVYVVSPASAILANWLRFREYMQAHPADVADYDAAKRLAITESHGCGEEYQRAKGPFLEALVKKIDLAAK